MSKSATVAITIYSDLLPIRLERVGVELVILLILPPFTNSISNIKLLCTMYVGELLLSWILWVLTTNMSSVLPVQLKTTQWLDHCPSRSSILSWLFSHSCRCCVSEKVKRRADTLPVWTARILLYWRYTMESLPYYYVRMDLYLALNYSVRVSSSYRFSLHKFRSLA